MKYTTVSLVFACFSTFAWSCNEGPPVRDSVQAVEANKNVVPIMQHREFRTEEWEQLRREDSLMKVGYARAGGEDVYNRWLPGQQMLFDYFKENRTQENKKALMDYMAEHRMCLIVPKPFLSEDDFPKEPRIHPRLILMEQDEISAYLDIFINRRPITIGKYRTTGNPSAEQ